MMRINTISLDNFRGFSSADIRLGDFTCLFGPNGIGKTTILEAISLVCASLDFGDIDVGTKDFPAVATAKARLEDYLRKNVRNVGEDGAASGFRIVAGIEHDGASHEVILTDKGFEKGITGEDWWWPGLAYMTQFDVDRGAFALPPDLWDKFASCWEAVTGFKAEPEIFEVAPGESENAASVAQEKGKRYVVNFWMHKPQGRTHFRKASAGEKKIAKALSQIIALPEGRLPDIVLVDNIEMHVYYKRHLATVEAIKDVFRGRQVVATTHSTVIVERYEPAADLVDVEALHEGVPS
jgi:predicted ATPase